MTESDNYDEIFAALKNPIRRQILLVLEHDGEVSFSNLQAAVGISDTGSMSYHLKELSSLIEQSERGKYRLSETGRAGVALFQKVENQKKQTQNSVHKELEKIVGELFFFFLIAGVSWGIPANFDVMLSVRRFSPEFTMVQLTSFTLIGFLGLVVGAILFTIYDRHYFSTKSRTNIIHSMLFAALISLVLFSSFRVLFPGDLSSSNIAITWAFGLRTVAYIGITPLIVYATSKFLNTNSWSKYFDHTHYRK